MRDANPQTIFLKDYICPDYLIHNVDLHFTLAEENTRVISKLTLSRNPASQTSDKSLILSGENLTLLRISLNEGEDLTEAQYLQTQDTLIIHEVPQQQRFILTIENTINPKANTALEGLYLSNDMLCTQCEAEGFRKITYFLDRPDVMAKFTTTLVGDKERYPVLLSNGNRIDQGELPNNQHWVTWEDPFDKPCYLFALVAGQLECVEGSFITQSGRNIGLQIFVEKHDLDKCDHALQSLKNAMRWDENIYGREYDLDLYMIVAVSHFNMGAMENKGLNVFNTKFVLARPDTATDSDYEHIEGVIGHEYFHNWTGNRITCRDWFQLSLKEGFTVFRDQQFIGDRTSKAVKRIEDVNMLRTRQFAEDAGPLAHPIRPDSYIEINNFYTLTVYEKGAEVVRMIHTLLGAEGFRKGSDLYFERHDGQAVTCDDFVSALEDAIGFFLSQFRRCYSQAGTPVLTVRQHYEPTAQSLTLTIRQSCPPTPGQAVKEPLHIPVKVGLINKDGSIASCKLQDSDQTSNEVILQLTQSEQFFTFESLTAQPVVSILRGFSAPVKLVMERNLEELAFLLSHDSDTFNRWEAGQHQAVTCFDFLSAMEDANGVDLSQFRRWYSQAGTPVLTVRQHYEPTAQTLTLTIRQSCPPTPGQAVKEPLHIPVKVGLINKDGSIASCKLQDSDQTSNEVILQLTQSEQFFTFESLTAQPVVSILRGFSAPVKLVMERNLEELAFLLSHDNDTFNRWEAGQQLAAQVISSLVEDIRTGWALHLNPIIVAAFKQVLEQSWDDLTYFSLLLSLPSETYLAEQMQVVDVEAIHKAREFVKQGLAQQLQTQFKALYLANHRDESGHFDAGAIGRRRIKNTCLSYLSKLGNADIQKWALLQFQSAKNMTDQIAALTEIVNNPHPAKEQCLADFYRQWQREALVIDKWFALQACSPMPDTFATVQALMRHPAFDLKNPNRVRALIGAFSQANPLHFHAATGQGYDFLADQIIALNTLNPQVASRMLSALTQWRRYDQGRQTLMKAQLERIMNTDAISKDVYEVASKSLA